MSLLLRTVLRHQSNGLSGLLRTQFRSISVYSVKFNEANRKKSDSASAVTKSSNISNVDLSTDMLPFTDRVKENTKTVSYMGVILVGVAVAGVLFYACLRELLSSTSSNNVYSAAFAACIDDPRVQDALGPPIKAYGEESRRGRRQHVASLAVDRHGQPSMQVRFYIQGIRNKATVQLEKRMKDGRYRYFFVQLDHYPHTTIILEDNRLEMDGTAESMPLAPPTDNLKF